jgi:hypothetical protein
VYWVCVIGLFGLGGAAMGANFNPASSINLNLHTQMRILVPFLSHLSFASQVSRSRVAHETMEKKEQKLSFRVASFY